jgi:hypothetical protein
MTILRQYLSDVKNYEIHETYILYPNKILIP